MQTSLFTRLFLLAPLAIAISSCSNADQKIHNACLNANDYDGCINSRKANLSKINVYKSNAYKKEFSNCMKDLRKSDFAKHLVGTSKEGIKKGCIAIAEEFSKNSNHIGKNFTDLFVTHSGNVNKYINLSDGYKLCMIGGFSQDFSNQPKEHRPSSNDIKSTCACTSSSYSKLPRRINNGKTFVGHPTKEDGIDKSCYWRAPSVTRHYGGMIYFKKQNANFSPDFAIQKSSIKQAKIRGSYGRYISFNGRTPNKFQGTSGYTIPGTPGYIDCNWGGGGGFYGDAYSIGGGYSSGGNCYGQEGTDPINIPGKSAGIQNRLFPYLLDCKDQTFDRKGDNADADGLAKKGWMNISNDHTAIYAHTVFCPIISELPKGN